MARTAVTKKKQAKYQDGLASNECRIDYAASDATNKNYIASYTPDLLVHVKNVHASTAKNVIITSVADRENRTGDLTIPVAAGESLILPPLSLDGFVQDNGQLYLEGEDNNIHLAVTIPR